MTQTVLIAALLACPPARTVGYSYVQPGYGYAQTYAAPAYQQQVVTKYIAVEYAPVYSAVAGDYVRAEGQAREQKELYEKIAKLTGAVDQLRQIVVVTGTAPQGAPAPQGGYAPAPSPQASPGYPTPQQAPQVPSKASYGLAVPPKDPYGVGPPPAVSSLPVLSDTAALNRCAGCHTGPAARGGVQIFSAPGVLADLSPDDWAAMDEAIVSGRMPKGGQPFTLAEYSAFAALKQAAVGGQRPTMAANRNPY